MVLNTEYKKVRAAKAPADEAEMTVTEDHLLNELLDQKVCTTKGWGPFHVKCSSFREEATKLIVPEIGRGG